MTPTRVATLSVCILSTAIAACSSDRPATAPPAPFRPEARMGQPPPMPPATPYQASSARGTATAQGPASSYGGSYASPRPSASYAPAPARSTPPPSAYVPPAPPPPALATSPSFSAGGGGFRWAGSLAEAQAEARATGRLIFVEEGRPACGNCMTLKNRIIPSPEVASDLASVAVGYYDDVDQNPNSQSFQILFANLPGAGTLPLCGFLTADLRWVHGYWGGRDAARFRSEIATARARARSMAALAPAATAPKVAAAASQAPAPAAPEPKARVVSAAAPAAPAAAAEDPQRAWARDRLDRAVDALAALDYRRARTILADVAPKAAGLPEERDVRHGEEAIERLDRIDRAESPAEAARLRDDARASLAGTCWAPLFP